MQNATIILEGTYLYHQQNVHYSQEDFKLVHLPEIQSYQVYAEITSRIETGEFLKILVRYEMNQHFIPHFVRIEKSIGNKYAQEVYKIDLSSFELHYTFQTAQGAQEFKRNISAKHYLTSPAVSTSALFTLSKRLDTATGRSPVTLISSENDWTYEQPPTDKIIYADIKAREMHDYKLNGNPLPASHLCLYEFDSNYTGVEEPVNLYLSKHYAIPYQLTHGDQNIVIKHLKRKTD